MTKNVIAASMAAEGAQGVGAVDAGPARAARAWHWIMPLEAVSALLTAAILILLLMAIVSRYVLASPLVWVDEAVSSLFLWMVMVGTIVAMHRNEHLRLTLFVSRLGPTLQRYVQACALVAAAAFLLALLPSAVEYTMEEWLIRTPALDLPNSFRVAAMPVGIGGMLIVIAAYALRTVGRRELVTAIAIVAAIAGLCAVLSPQLRQLHLVNVFVFLGVFVAVCVVAGVPIGFCFGLGTLCFLAFSTHTPIQVIVSRMDEGMSSIILVSVPMFVLLGCVLDATGMGKAIIDFMSSLLGHIKAGMSYVMLGSLFIVSGISGSKVSDMATVAPALFPEMERRGHQRPKMVALLATGAAMADTVPPSIVLIVLGAVANVSIAGLFQSGFVVAMILLLTLLVLERWKARHENTEGARRPAMRRIGWTMLIAAPALLLPFLIRSAVGGGVATATEVSTLAVVYTVLVGNLLYGGISARALYRILVETASLSGALLLIMGTASGMAWALTQSGIAQALSVFMTELPGGPYAFLAMTIVVFLVAGCVLEGLPAVLLLAPILFPIAKKLGIHDIHYAMVIVTAMNIGLMTPPIGVGFYAACRIGNCSPDAVMRAIWPYLGALLAGAAVIAAVPWISTVALQ